jgi:hypothetical protein
MVLRFMEESISSIGVRNKAGKRQSGVRAQVPSRQIPPSNLETFVPVAKPEIGAHTVYIVGHGWAAGE